MKNKINKKAMRSSEKSFGMIFLFAMMLAVLALPIASAAANFAVNSFSCTPTEVVINDVFSCTAQIKNNGDAAGSVSVATLYTDSNDWLEDSNYAQGSGTSVDPGQTAEVIFTSLRATKSGSNGFSKVMLDSVTDNYVSDNNVKVNVINVLVTVGNSVSSAVMGASFDSTAEVTSGGNIDVSLTFVINSGGCSIGSQTNPKTISGMQDGNKQSRTWSVTQGTTSGDCYYTISAAATGTGGIASKIDSTGSSVACPDCPEESSDDDSSSSGGSGGGGGGGTTAAAVVYNFGSVGSQTVQELSSGGSFKFKILGEEHTLRVTNVTDTMAMITIQSATQTFSFAVGDEVNVDLNSDGVNEIMIRLRSINIITGKAKFVLTALVSSAAADDSAEAETADGGSSDDGVSNGGDEDAGLAGGIKEIFNKENSLMWIVVIIIILVLVGGIFLARYLKRKRDSRFDNKVKVVDKGMGSNKIVLVKKKK